MQVGELFSGPTIGSSRTLTIYSATVTAILSTDTELKNLPGIGSLSASEYQLQWMMLILLLFMTFSHSVNWYNDLIAIRAKNDLDIARTTANSESKRDNPIQYLRKKTNSGEISGTQVCNLPSEHGSYLAKLALDAEKSGALIKIVNWLLRYGMHLFIPLTLSIYASIQLIDNMS